MRSRKLLLAFTGGLLATYACQDSPAPSELEPATAEAVVQRTLTVSGAGTGDGVVRSSPAGINCTITNGVAGTSGCVANFDHGTVVTLTATPAAGSSLANWSVKCKGADPCVVTMTAAHTVVARFLEGPFVIRIAGAGTGGGSGTVRSQPGLSPAINCVITNGTAAATGCKAKYPANTELAFTATPAAGQGFAGWSGLCSGTGDCEFKAVKPGTITATFAPGQQLTIQGSGAGTGTVTSQDGLTPAIDCDITGGTPAASGCSASYGVGTVVTLTATPSGSSLFTGWTGACTGTGTCQVTMSQARTVTAGFSLSGSSPVAREGRWEPQFSTPVIGVHMHMLPTGKVLMWGNGGESELWDPTTGGFRTINNPFEVFCSGHTYLADGRLLVAGGHISNDHGLPSTAIFDPTDNSWRTLAPMARGRWYPSLTTLPNGDVLAVAGGDQNGDDVAIPEVWNGSSWRQLTSASQLLAYYPRMFVAPNGRVFQAGAGGITRYLDVGAGQWTTVGQRNQSSRNYGSAVMYAPGRILYTGGGMPPVRTVEIINLNQASPSWQLVSSMGFARRHHNATLLADGKVLVTHGTSGDGFNNAAAGVRDAEMWDPATSTWETMAREASIRVYHSTAMLLPDGRVLSAGSGDGGGSPQTFSAQVFTPPYLFNPDGSFAVRPTISSAPSRISYGNQFTVQSPDAAGVTRGSLIRLSSVTHAMNETQRIYPLTFTRNGDTGLTAGAPPSANVAPPGPYLLFLLNGNGVPSMARFVSVGP